jgi:hypothetical protein
MAKTETVDDDGNVDEPRRLLVIANNGCIVYTERL